MANYPKGERQMLTNLQEICESLAQKREQLLQRLSSLSHETLLFKAGADKWSVVEAIEHMVMVEENFVEQVTNKNPTPPLDPESRSAKKYQTVITLHDLDDGHGA